MTNDTRQFDENAVCETCGRFGAFNLGGEWLCAECYEGRASCCPEFGADDLWEMQENQGAERAGPNRESD